MVGGYRKGDFATPSANPAGGIRSDVRKRFYETDLCDFDFGGCGNRGGAPAEQTGAAPKAADGSAAGNSGGRGQSADGDMHYTDPQGRSGSIALPRSASRGWKRRRRRRPSIEAEKAAGSRHSRRATRCVLSARVPSGVEVEKKKSDLDETEKAALETSRHGYNVQIGIIHAQRVRSTVGPDSCCHKRGGFRANPRRGSSSRWTSRRLSSALSNSRSSSRERDSRRAAERSGDGCRG